MRITIGKISIFPYSRLWQKTLGECDRQQRMFTILWFLIHFYFFYFLAFVFPLFLFRIFLLDFYCFEHFVITRFHVFVAIVCDDGWVPYNNQCYLFSSSVDIFPNAMVRFDFMGVTKLVIIIS